MASKQPTATAPAPRVHGVTGKFYTVGCSSHLLYEAVEVTVVDGLVVATRRLSRAPDLAQAAVGICSRETWQALRKQQLSGVLGDGEAT